MARARVCEAHARLIGGKGHIRANDCLENQYSSAFPDDSALLNCDYRCDADDRARLAAARRHHYQRLAVMVALERLANAADGPRLIEPVDDGFVDRRVSEWLTAVTPLDQQRELVFLVESRSELSCLNAHATASSSARRA